MATELKRSWRWQGKTQSEHLGSCCDNPLERWIREKWWEVDPTYIWKSELAGFAILCAMLERGINLPTGTSSSLFCVFSGCSWIWIFLKRNMFHHRMWTYLEDHYSVYHRYLTYSLSTWHKDRFESFHRLLNKLRQIFIYSKTPFPHR